MGPLNTKRATLDGSQFNFAWGHVFPVPPIPRFMFARKRLWECSYEVQKFRKKEAVWRSFTEVAINLMNP